MEGMDEWGNDERMREREEERKRRRRKKNEAESAVKCNFNISNRMAEDWMCNVYDIDRRAHTHIHLALLCIGILLFSSFTSLIDVLSYAKQRRKKNAFVKRFFALVNHTKWEDEEKSAYNRFEEMICKEKKKRRSTTSLNKSMCVCKKKGKESESNANSINVATNENWRTCRWWWSLIFFFFLFRCRWFDARRREGGKVIRSSSPSSLY